MPTSEELEQMLTILMEDLNDRAGTGGKGDDDQPVEGDYHGDHQ